MFRRKRRKTSPMQSLQEAGLESPLDAIPVREDQTEAKIDERQRAQIRRRLPPKRGVYGWVARRFGYTHDIRVDLDDMGTAFWSLIDDRRDLRRIARELEGRVDGDAEAAQRASVLFTRNLMIRRLIFLRLPEDSDGHTREVRMRT